MREHTAQPTRVNRKYAWPLLVAALIASSYAMIFADSEEGGTWRCAPLSTTEHNSELPPCFSAEIIEENRVQLRWLLDDPGNSVYIYSDRPPNYNDLDLSEVHCETSRGGICSKELAVTEGGHYQWTLAVTGPDTKSSHTSARLDIPPPTPPRLLTGGGFVDLLDPQAQVFTWEANIDSDEEHWVEVKNTQSFKWPETRLASAGPEASYRLPAETFHTWGEQVFLLRGCHLPKGSSRKFCSPPVRIGYRPGFDHFIGERNRHLPEGQAADIKFTALSGHVRLLSSPSLLDSDLITTTADSITIPAEKMTRGEHEISLDSCLLPEGPCSNRVNAERAGFPAMLWQKQPGRYAKGDVIGTLFPLDRSASSELLAPASGEVRFIQDGPIHYVETGHLMAYSLTEPADMLRLVIGSPTVWTTDRDYTLDFHPGKALSSKGFGQALDITFDDAGGIWMLNEFANSIEHASRAGQVESLAVPVARQHEPLPRHYYTMKASRPFAIVAGDDGLARRTTVSALAEKIAYIDGRLWFTQGGGLLSNAPAVPNHSRVVSFDPSLSDLPDTPFDDRFCIYTMPAADQGNAQIIGVAGSRGRIWVAESRGLANDDPSYLSAFIPDDTRCANLLDYDQSESVARLALRYCEPGRTPEQDRCVQRIELPATTRPLKIAHLQADPEAGLLWFTDASGQFLGSYDTDGEQGVLLRPLEDTHLAEFDTVGNLGGFPWDLEVTHEAIYIGEYASRHILRYDKFSNSFSEISVPYAGRMMRLHSMAVDALRHRLWFTLANECAFADTRARSTLGYIDLASWQEYIDHPNGEQTIEGVTYSGLQDIPSCDMRPASHQSFRGIAIDPKTGRIALATMLREQFTLLDPLPGFWP
jgi:hypothetical protein